MFSYKIITKDHYDHLQSYSGQSFQEIENLAKRNFQLFQENQKLNTKIKHGLIELKQKDTQILVLNQNLTELETQLIIIRGQLKLSVQKQRYFVQKLNETTDHLNKFLKQKEQLILQRERINFKINELESIVQSQKYKMRQTKEKEQMQIQRYRNKAIQLQEKLKLQVFQKKQLIQSVDLQILTIQNLNQQINNCKEQIQKNNSLNQQLKELNAKLNTQNQDKTLQLLNIIQKVQGNKSLIQKITSEYQALKQEKLSLEKQIEKFQKSPIAQLHLKLDAKQNWIHELTKTVNELKQKNLYLQMQRQNPIFSAAMRNTSTYKNAQNSQNKVIINRSASQQAQRLKYLNICKQLLQQFNTKLKKIQGEKKTIQQKYHSIKLKLNQYQYNQFKYKDRLSLYLQKIERYQKLTQKQQNEMEKFIFQFDQQLNKIIQMKQDQIQQKIQYEVFKYQLEFQKLKQQQLQKMQQQQLSRLKQTQQKNKEDAQNENQQVNSNHIQNQNLQSQKHKISQQLQINHNCQQNALIQSKHSIDYFDFQILKQQLQLLKKDLKKYQQSKRKYKKQTFKLQSQCQKYSVEIRRYKDLVQQLIKQLEIKTNQNQILKYNLRLYHSKPSSGNRTNQFATSRLLNAQDFNENLSARNSAKNTGKRSGSDKYQYQISEIDVDLQFKTNMLINKPSLLNNINKLIFPNNIMAGKDPALPELYLNKMQFKDNKVLNNESQISYSSSQGKSSYSSHQSNQSNSFQSKNSYKSYGINNLWRDKDNSIKNIQQKYLLHKNSLQ